MSHSNDRSHGPTNYNRAFIISVTLNTGFVVVEVIYGLVANSLALLADAGHNLSDVLGLLLAWGASFLGRRQPTPRRTYGLRRSSILAALLNAILVLVASGAVAWEAIQRFLKPSPVSGSTIIGVAAVGIAINMGSALMFLSGRERDLNIRGAFLHLVADAAVSLGAVLAGIAIVTTGWLWFDPVVSLMIVVVIVMSTWQLFQESLNLVTDAVPADIEPLAVRTYLAELPGVASIHDLHIWAMSTTETALTAHLIMPTGHPGDAFLEQVNRELHDNFSIEHTTIQIEFGDPNYPCPLTQDNTVV
ncbi:cation transporter [Fischerella thermalis CCMEE 5273]|uniref:Cobalt transporter n=1 Tax=Chlorogloeopsis fritschii PCC 6912 TaxID=211165 RepID=A0A3S5K294_CHLFR|nr:cation diffusion facilitator family transporter [Chlorogloeopsis fritschii]PMB09470.1 cation transporter [Fischerella thermalis CCMEE 5273]PMB50414.1 cation transporter [Fischerella thermalis CCMEE 5205]RUR83728.1 cobalt transporter [Chlorogloeopsis fritschii PCC 6912]